MAIDYKNVYDLRDYEQAIYAAKRKLREAEEAVKVAEKKYKEQCAKQIGVDMDDIEVSNVCCVAKGIISHVYHIKVHQRYGSAANKCIFCGCDNWDD